MRSARRPKPATRGRPVADGTSGAATSNGSAAAEPAAVGDNMFIELSRQQINQILRAESDAGNLTVFTSRLTDTRKVLAVSPAQRRDSRFSRSLLAGLVVLASFPADGTYLGNLEVARTLGMSPSTAHRYLSTLVAAGLLERNPDTRQYRLAW
jgi:IclR helix-turn-helix domain